MDNNEYEEIIYKYKKENEELIKTRKCRHVFLEILPYKINKNKKRIIDWKNSVGYKIHFIYDGIEDDLEILEYIKDKQKLKIKYNKIFYFQKENLTNNRLAKIVGKRTSYFKAEVGQTIKDYKRNLTLIDIEYRKIIKNNKYKENRKYYKYHCNKCGNEDWIEENNLLGNKSTGCNRCCCSGSNKKIDKTNCLATTNPELMKYIVNENYVYRYSKGSSKKILCRCPNCGYEKYERISDLVNYGFSCTICGDGFSYPEKLTMTLLETLKENYKIKNFTHQLTKTKFKWCDKYRYDFYFEYNNEKYIIETHGSQHYNGSFGYMGGRTLQEEQENDLNKYNLATQNGIKPENYIVIDCRKSKLEWIKDNILKSKLNEIFDLNNVYVDWNEIELASKNSKIKEICNYWYLHNDINKEGLTITDLLKVLPFSRSCITKYLKEGSKLGLCNYNAKEELIKSGEKHKRSVEVFKREKSLGVFDSCIEVEKISEKLFKEKLFGRSIARVARGERKQYKGFVFKYI